MYPETSRKYHRPLPMNGWLTVLKKTLNKLLYFKQDVLKAEFSIPIRFFIQTSFYQNHIIYF